MHLSLAALKPAQAAWTSKFQEMKTEYQAGRLGRVRKQRHWWWSQTRLTRSRS